MCLWGRDQNHTGVAKSLKSVSASAWFGFRTEPQMEENSDEG